MASSDRTSKSHLASPAPSAAPPAGAPQSAMLQAYSNYLQPPHRNLDVPRPHPNHHDLTALGRNEFPVPGPEEEPSPKPIPAKEAAALRPRSPSLFVDPPEAEGTRREVNDDDYKGGAISGSESEHSDNFAEVEFTSIKTIGDGGLGTWEPHHSRHPHDSSSETPLPEVVQTANDEIPTPPEAAAAAELVRADSTNVVFGTGTSFPNARGNNPGNPERLAKTFDADLDAELQEILENGLRDACRTSEFSQTEFLPLGELCYILSRAKILGLLAQTFPKWDQKQLEAATDSICGSAVPSTGRRKLLAILVLMDKVDTIDYFIKAEVLDIHLPLDVVSVSRRRWSLCKRGDDTPRGALRSIGWTRLISQTFRMTQALMMVSYFNLPPNEIYYYKLGQEFTLPFIHYKQAHQGGFGRVWKVRIHRSHHNYRHHEHLKDDNPFFALKAIDSPDPEFFKKEVEVLQRFSGANNPNPHLIRLLLAFRFRDTHYLLFPWADGNLREFWSRHPNPVINWRRSRWVIKQCHGIAKGLQKIHHVKSNSFPEQGDYDGKDWGRHGDIKPENILYFDEDDQRLVISDFGLSRYHSYRSKTRDPNETLEGFSPTYRPPECDTHGLISPRYDVWALGCVFIELLSWFILGNSSTYGTFSKARIRDEGLRSIGRLREDKFFKVLPDESNFRGIAIVKPSVVKWIWRLHSHEKCPKFVHEFLDLIEEHLLLVDSNKRWECANIVAELNRIRLQCEESEEYSVRGAARQHDQSLDRVSVADEEEAIDVSDDDEDLEVYEFNEPGPGLPATIEELTPSDDSAYHDGWSGDVTPEALEASGLSEDNDVDEAPLDGELAHITAGIIKNDSSMSKLDTADEELDGYEADGYEADGYEADGYEADDGSDVRRRSREAVPEGKTARRSIDGRKAPALVHGVTTDTLLTTQGSHDAGRVYSADTTPPVTSPSSREALRQGTEPRAPLPQKQAGAEGPGRKSTAAAADRAQDSSPSRASSSHQFMHAQGVSDVSVAALPKVSHDSARPIANGHTNGGAVKGSAGVVGPCPKAGSTRPTLRQTPDQRPVASPGGFKRFFRTLACFNPSDT
ncbi:kinase-like protein [Thozetella sp. PMI_491]|nr:kinase-like protein [Thozetella sp. PMI_491]